MNIIYDSERISTILKSPEPWEVHLRVCVEEKEKWGCETDTDRPCFDTMRTPREATSGQIPLLPRAGLNYIQFCAGCEREDLAAITVVNCAGNIKVNKHLRGVLGERFIPTKKSCGGYLVNGREVIAVVSKIEYSSFLMGGSDGESYDLLVATGSRYGTVNYTFKEGQRNLEFMLRQQRMTVEAIVNGAINQAVKKGKMEPLPELNITVSV